MKRTILAIAAALALTVGFTGAAAAQDGPTIVSDPASVEAAGEHELTVTGSGYTEAAFLLPCPGAGGDPGAIAEDSCDTGALTPVTPDADGNWMITVTYDIPAEGLVIVAGNAAQTEVGATVVTVGAAAAEEPAAEEPVAETTSEELPDTGAESYVLVLIGAFMLAAGALMLNTGRQISQG